MKMNWKSVCLVFTIMIVFFFIKGMGALAQPTDLGVVSPEAFDGSRFSKRYGLDSHTDFWAAKDDEGKMHIYLKEGLTISDTTPIFEAPDATKINRMAALRTKLASSDLTVPEISEYLRLRDGI